MRTVPRVAGPLVLAAVLAGLACRQTATQRALPEEAKLPAPQTKGEVSVEEAIARRRSVREFAPTPLTWAEIGQLAWAAQGITEPTRKLRSAPSAGALYPLEAYFVTPDGLYHYLPDGHRMERLSDRDLRPDLQAAALNQAAVGQAPLVIVIAGVYERTARKYGPRAERYVYMEAGHVGQNIQLQAVALELGSLTIGGFPDDQVAKALGLPEDQRPLYLIPVGHPRTQP